MRVQIWASVFFLSIAAVSEARTNEQVAATLGVAARARLRPDFERAGLAYPPARVQFLVFKDERRLEVWGRDQARSSWTFVRSYPVLAASGTHGPKLRQGDLQVPEGLYRILWLNPNSQFHLSMKVDYPNTFDRRKAAQDGRTNLGGDIFIHGSQVSIGCVALGDPAIEELFVLAHDTGVRNLGVLIAPVDLRRRELPPHAPAASWTGELYTLIRRELAAFPPPSP